MVYEELIKYWIPAVDSLGLGLPTGFGDWKYGKNGFAPYLKLDKLLGTQEYSQYYKASVFKGQTLLPEDLKRLLVMLRGPHAKAILKAYRIQKGLENDVG